MKISLSKKDIVWSYLGQFFSMASGLLVLPLILRLLTPEEIGMNYLMLTIGSMVSLFDFGFAPQFGRNISYIFSGAQVLLKEGVDINYNEKNPINYRLLTTMIHTAKYIYKILAFIVLFVMLTFGTLYIYKVTNRFSNVNNSLIVWIVYSISIFFNVYYTYYTSLLSGQGKIMETKKAMVYSRIAYIFLVLILLLSGFGLLGVCLANLIAPFLNRYLSYNYFYTKELKEKVNDFLISKKEKFELFSIIWYNSKKLGIVFISSYAITKFGMFLAGLYLTLKDVSSYGLLIQFVGIILTISGTYFTIQEPKLSALKVTDNKQRLLKDFTFSMGIYYFIYIIGGLFLLLFVPRLLLLIKSNATLPNSYIVLLYLIVMFLEYNHSFFATIIVIGNSIPFMWISLITGVSIAFFSYFSLAYTSMGLLGLIVAQGIVQLAYNNWKWPYIVCKDFGINFYNFIFLSFSELYKRIKYEYLVR
ncbi:MAG: O-unit flippase-like protein [Bacteroidia bacterium]